MFELKIWVHEQRSLTFLRPQRLWGSGYLPNAGDWGTNWPENFIAKHSDLK